MIENYQNKRQPYQWEVVLNMLRCGSITTQDIFKKWIMAPQKVIQELRDKDYKILTEPVEGQKYKKYTLISEPEPKQISLGF